MLIGVQGQQVAANLGGGGTVKGDLIVEGDIKIEGGGSFAFDEIIEGTQVIDVTNTEAFLVRKDSDGGDVFVVDTTNSRIGINTNSPSAKLHVVGSDSNGVLKIQGGGGVAGIHLTRNGTDVNHLTTTGANLVFVTGGSTRMLLNSNGLGIGTTSPLHPLTLVAGSVSNTGLHLANSGNSDGGNTSEIFVGSTAGSHWHNLRINAYEIFLKAAGTDRLVVKSNGRVGIGTASPNTLLHIEGSSFPTALIKGGSSGSVLRLQGANNDSVVFNDNTADKWFLRYQPGANKIDFLNNGLSLSALTILDSNNNIGINTASPSYGLHLDNKQFVVDYTGIGFGHRDNSNNQFRLFTNISSGVGELYIRNASDANKVFLTGNGNSFINGGNVGIGTTSPATHLHVNGNIRYNEWQTSNGNAIVYTNGTDSILKIFKANGSDFSQINSNGTSYLMGGNVGIGTTSPTADLHVKSVDSTHSQIRIESGSTNHQTYFTMEADRPSANNTIANIQFTSAGTLAGDIKYNRGSADNIGHFEFGTGAGGGTRFVLNDNSRISLSNNDSGASNTILGKSAGNSIVSGANQNVIIGNEAGLSANSTSVDNNVIIGNQAGTGGSGIMSGCIYIGASAGTTTHVRNQYDNTFIGKDVAKLAFGGQSDNNVGIGSGAMSTGSLNTASNNVAVGKFSLKAVSTGGNNVAVGAEALDALTGGSFNVAIGSLALSAEDTAIGSIAIGYKSLEIQNGNGKNVAIGYLSSSRNTTGEKNVMVGYEAGLGTVSGNWSKNVGVGHNALYKLQTGEQNVALGDSAGFNITTGSKSVGIGANALANITTDQNVVAIGYNAYFAQDTSNDAEGSSGHGSGNIAIGYQSMQSFNHVNFLRNTAIGFQTMSAGGDADAQDNVALGYRALQLVEGADKSTALGSKALKSLTAGNANLAIGFESSRELTGGAANITIGHQAMLNATGISSAIFIGANAGDAITSSIDPNGTIGIGDNALGALTTGASNVAVGFEAGKDLTTGHSNTFLGYGVGSSFDSGESNMTAIGRNAMGSANNDSSANCVAIGVGALEGGTGLIANSIAIGKDALSSSGNRNISNSIAIGINAMDSTCGGGVTDCIAIGRDSMHHASNQLNGATGSIGIGAFSLQALTSGSNNVALGYQAGYSSDSNGSNVFIGANAGYEADSSTISAINNVYIGESAGRYLDDGNNNVAIGLNAMASNSDGAGNSVNSSIAIGRNAMAGSDTNVGSISIGYFAGDDADADIDNAVIIGRESARGALTSSADGTIAVGYQALAALTSGARNTAIGYQASINLQTGSDNTTLGYQVGASSTIGAKNVLIGTYAGNTIVEDRNCTAIGYSALLNANGGGSDGSATDTNNTAVGANAGDVITTGVNNTIIGKGSDPSANNATNQTVVGFAVTGVADNSVVLGNSAVTKVYMSSDGDAEIYANGTINTSDKRLKENIDDSDLGLEFVNKLRPVKYNYIKDKHDGKTKYGIIAQEVQEVLKESNNEDFAGIKDSDEYLGADYIQFVAPLIKAVQELSAEVNQLKQQLKDK
tara:strand:- start:17807 stop:22447 length:4641 start_codon:yes stop_codon:yes gene_type:complete